jgi:hypothetical protein
MAVQRPPAFRGRTSELDALDRLLEVCMESSGLR